jgi:hypothetical protein
MADLSFFNSTSSIPTRILPYSFRAMCQTQAKSCKKLSKNSSQFRLSSLLSTDYLIARPAALALAGGFKRLCLISSDPQPRL